MKKYIDLTGQRFGSLTVIQRGSRPENAHNKHAYWVCVCDCGNKTIASSVNLRKGNVKSCGCRRVEHCLGLKETNTKHGLSHSRLFKIWRGMLKRCENPQYCKYQDYGARGITVCPEWRVSFEAFYEWSMENGYLDHLTLDRKDNDGPYSPENCRWTTPKVQGNNKRNNHLVTYNGETHTVAEWADIVGLKRITLSARLNRGWPIEKALTKDPHR